MMWYQMATSNWSGTARTISGLLATGSYWLQTRGTFEALEGLDIPARCSGAGLRGATLFGVFWRRLTSTLLGGEDYARGPRHCPPVATMFSGLYRLGQESRWLGLRNPGWMSHGGRSFRAFVMDCSWTELRVRAGLHGPQVKYAALLSETYAAAASTADVAAFVRLQDTANKKRPRGLPPPFFNRLGAGA